MKLIDFAARQRQDTIHAARDSKLLPKPSRAWVLEMGRVWKLRKGVRIWQKHIIEKN